MRISGGGHCFVGVVVVVDCAVVLIVRFVFCLLILEFNQLVELLFSDPRVFLDSFPRTIFPS